MILQYPRRIYAPDAAGTDAVGEILVRVVKVLDGDGFLASVQDPLRDGWGRRIPFRFAFIDAPEMGQLFADEAKGFLGSLILGRSLKLTLIGKQSTGYMPFDRYRRLLCMGFLTETMQAGSVDYLFHGKRGTGRVKVARPVTRNIELEMIVNGWAWVLEQYAFDREDEYLQAEEDARRNRRGLWAMDNPEPPWTYKQEQRRRRAPAQRQPGFL